MNPVDHPPQRNVRVECRPRHKIGCRADLCDPPVLKTPDSTDDQRRRRLLRGEPGYPLLDFAPSSAVENMLRERLRKDDESIAVPAVNSGS